MLDHIAAGRTDRIFDWLDRGGAPDAEADGTSLIQWCAYYGDVSGMRHLLTQGVPIAALGDNLDLNGAAFHGHWQLCAFLLEQGADPNRPLDQSGETPLHAALCKFESVAHEQVVRVLLAGGADPNRATRAGTATGCFMRDVRNRGETPLHRAAAYGTPASIAMLLEAGARVDARDAQGDSPLSWGSWANRDTETLRLLCFPPHHIHASRKSMRVLLIGEPRPTA